MVNFKEKYHFSRFQRGSNRGPTFSRGGGGGSNCLFPIETHITCDFPGGPDTLSPTLDPHLTGTCLPGGDPTFSRGGPTFSRGGGGSNCLFPIETHITCDFPGGPDPLSPTLDPHLTGTCLPGLNQY